jgi:hypothetical protein
VTGLDALRAELEALHETLKAFGDPVVSEHAGLRLMRQTLTDREAHIAEQIEKGERCTLTLALTGIDEGGVDVTLLVPLLETLQAGAIAVGRRLAEQWPAITQAHADHAVALRVTAMDQGPSVTLQRPPGPLSAQLADPTTGVPLVEQALDRLLAVLSEDKASGPDTAEPLRQLTAVIAANPLQLELSLSGARIEPRSVTVDRADAVRLHESLGG